jgi:hypothetical protein
MARLITPERTAAALQLQELIEQRGWMRCCPPPEQNPRGEVYRRVGQAVADLCAAGHRLSVEWVEPSGFLVLGPAMN